MLICHWLKTLRSKARTAGVSTSRFPQDRRFHVSQRPASRFRVFLNRRHSMTRRIVTRRRSRLP
ncbi:MAG: hypothetical protein ACE5KM_02400 [Planctomycetaceae bacterium]